MLTDSPKSNVELLHERARLQADLLTVSKREAATIARHDAKMETAEARIAQVARLAECHRANAETNYEKWAAAEARIAELEEALNDMLSINRNTLSFLRRALATLTGGKADAEKRSLERVTTEMHAKAKSAVATKPRRYARRA
jgi:hypothetical protein